MTCISGVVPSGTSGPSKVPQRASSTSSELFSETRATQRRGLAVRWVQSVGDFVLISPKLAWFKAKASGGASDPTRRDAFRGASVTRERADAPMVLVGRGTGIQRAIALNRTTPWPPGYGNLLSVRGRSDAAIWEMRRALELDPLLRTSKTPWPRPSTGPVVTTKRCNTGATSLHPASELGRSASSHPRQFTSDRGGWETPWPNG